MTDDWLGERARSLSDRLAARGFATDLPHARRLVARRVMDTARARRISSVDACNYVTDSVLDQMAEWFAADHGELTDDHDEQRSSVALVSVSLLGRAVTALAEALLARRVSTRNGHGAHSGSTSDRELLELIHTLGETVADVREPDRAVVPLAVLVATARELDAAAAGEAVPGDAAATWRREAMRLRGVVH